MAETPTPSANQPGAKAANAKRPVIRVLDDHVANQIAAGEVIERPAAVVKELLENSLDAGATRIEIEYRNGGKSYIRVQDDGCGMFPDEALLAFERHATSKLRDARDLATILTMGFRGEALPSIASISRFSMRTRPAEAVSGCEILFSHGKLLHRKECGMPPGTRIEVANLFQSVPARRKFLRTDRTEAAHIQHLCRLYAVAHPEVAFSLIEDGRLLLRSPLCTNLRDRIAEIWNAALANELLTLDRFDRPPLSLEGMIAPPGSGRSTRQDMITVVNGRPVDSRALKNALTEAYHARIPKGRYPAAFLFLDLPPEAVDVNVHPTKREIRFRDEGMIRGLVIDAVLARLTPSNTAPPPSPAPIPLAHHTPPPAAATPAPPPPQPKAAPSPRPRPTPLPPAHFTDPQAAPADDAHTPRPSPTPAPTAAAPQPPPAGQPKTGDSWAFRCRLANNLILFESERGLILFNWRAARERVLYEEILTDFEVAKPRSQGLLIPLPIEFDPLSAAALEENITLLTQQGFAIEPFGRNFYRIEAVPEWLNHTNAEPFIRDAVSFIRENTLRKSVVKEEFARMAASRTIRHATPPDETTITFLRNQLNNCKEPLICPNGKPISSELTWAEIQRRF